MAKQKTWQALDQITAIKKLTAITQSIWGKTPTINFQVGEVKTRVWVEIEIGHLFKYEIEDFETKLARKQTSKKPIFLSVNAWCFSQNRLRIALTQTK